MDRDNNALPHARLTHCCTIISLLQLGMMCLVLAPALTSSWIESEALIHQRLVKFISIQQLPIKGSESVDSIGHLIEDTVGLKNLTSLSGALRSDSSEKVKKKKLGIV